MSSNYTPCRGKKLPVENYFRKLRWHSRLLCLSPVFARRFFFLRFGNFFWKVECNVFTERRFPVVFVLMNSARNNWICAAVRRPSSPLFSSFPSVCSFVESLIYLFTQLFAYFLHSLSHLLTCIHLLFFIHLLSYSSYSFIYLFIHLYTHSCTLICFIKCQESVSQYVSKWMSKLKIIYLLIQLLTY